MKIYDAKKTKELLKFLKDEEETSIEDLSSILCKKIVGIRLRAARGKMGVSVNLKSLGVSVDSKDEDIKEFMKENLSAGSFSFFNKKDINKIDNLIGITRQALYRSSIATNGSIYYLTEENYKEFKEVFFSKYLVRFNEIKEELILKLDINKKSFDNKLSKWFELMKLDEDEAKNMRRKYLSQFPTEEEVKRRVQMNYYTIAFPVFNQINIEGIDGDISRDLLEDKDNETVQTFYTMIANSLLSLFEVVGKTMEAINMETVTAETMPLDLNLASRTKGMLARKIKDIENNNNVLKNERIDKILKIFKRTFYDREDATTTTITNGKAAEISELLLASIYSYAKYLEVEEFFEAALEKSIYSVEDLELIEAIAVDLEDLL